MMLLEQILQPKHDLQLGQSPMQLDEGDGSSPPDAAATVDDDVAAADDVAVVVSPHSPLLFADRRRSCYIPPEHINEHRNQSHRRQPVKWKGYCLCNRSKQARWNKGNREIYCHKGNCGCRQHGRLCNDHCRCYEDNADCANRQMADGSIKRQRAPYMTSNRKRNVRMKMETAAKKEAAAAAVEAKEDEDSYDEENDAIYEALDEDFDSSNENEVAAAAINLSQQQLHRSLGSRVYANRQADDEADAAVDVDLTSSAIATTESATAAKYDQATIAEIDMKVASDLQCNEDHQNALALQFGLHQGTNAGQLSNPSIQSHLTTATTLPLNSNSMLTNEDQSVYTSTHRF